MRAVVWGVMAALGAIVGACATVPSPVPVVGAGADLDRLTGEWGGENQGQSSGRSGSIVFKLAAGADTAYGDVVMIPRERRESRLPVQDPSIGLPVPRTPEVLTIAFVRATDGGLSGRLTPYRDPDCGCTLLTRFQGRIRGDVIEGTFTSTPQEGGATQSGTWKVTRKKE
jgi:hypothetical protein